MKKVFFLLSTATLMLCSLSAQAMDLSGYDVKLEQFYPEGGRKADLNSYSEHFRTLCPRKYGAEYRFSSYIEKQIPMTLEEKNLLNAYVESAYRARISGDFIGFHNYRSMALELIENQKTDVFALCVAVGPSKKAAWKKNIDSVRTDIEFFMAKLGYYDLKFRLFNYFSN